MPDEKRVERIRKEILKAKEVAGIAPPRLIPRGDAFRAEATSQPHGAVSFEREHADMLRVSESFALAAAPEPEVASKAMVKAMAEPTDRIIAGVEMALARVAPKKVPEKLRSELAAQLNALAALRPDDGAVEKLQIQFDAVLFGEQDMPDSGDVAGGAMSDD